VTIFKGHTLLSIAQTKTGSAKVENKKADTSTQTLKSTGSIPPEKSENNPVDAGNVPVATQSVTVDNYLSDAQKQVLGNYLDTSSSNMQLLFSLMQAAEDNQNEVRDSALEVIRKILMDNPTWANSNSLNLISELFSTNDKQPELSSIFQLLNIFLEANPETSSEIQDLAFTIIKTNTNKDHTASPTIALLFRNLATISPNYVKDIMLVAQADADDKNRDEEVRVEIIRILNSIADVENVRADLTNMDKLFSIILQDAQDSSIYVTNEVVPVLTTITKTNPEYAEKAFTAVLRSTKSEDYATRSSGLSTLKFFVKADNSYAQPVYEAAIAATQDEQALVRWNALTVLATVVKADPKYAQGTLEVALKATNEEDLSVSIMALRLLKALVKLDDQYPNQALSVAAKATEHKYQEVRIEALKLVATIVDSDPNCAATSFEIGNKAVQQPDEQVRWNGLLLLLSVVKAANKEYAQKVFEIAVKSTTDKFWFIRQDGLVVIQNIVEDSPQYAIRAYPIAAKLIKDENDNVRVSAISTLETLLKANPQLITNIYKLAVMCVKDKVVEVRKQVWYLLQAILKTDAQYIQQKEIRGMIREASLDTDATIRQIAHDLLVTYLLKE
jgi:hypothetical protein